MHLFICQEKQNTQYPLVQSDSGDAMRVAGREGEGVVVLVAFRGGQEIAPDGATIFHAHNLAQPGNNRGTRLSEISKDY